MISTVHLMIYHSARTERDTVVVNQGSTAVTPALKDQQSIFIS